MNIERILKLRGEKRGVRLQQHSLSKRNKEIELN
jgi:hypothetical protein